MCESWASSRLTSCILPPNCESRKMCVHYLSVSRLPYRLLFRWQWKPSEYLASTLLHAGLEAGDSPDMSGEVAESLLLHKHSEEIPSQMASNRDFVFFFLPPDHSFLFVTEWDNYLWFFISVWRIDGSPCPTYQHAAVVNVLSLSANEVSNVSCFPGEKCRSFLYVAPSNERGKSTRLLTALSHWC